MKLPGWIGFLLIAVVTGGGCENLVGFKPGDKVIVSRIKPEGETVPDHKLIWLIAPTEKDLDLAREKIGDEHILELLGLVAEGRARIIEGPEMAVFLKSSGKYAQIELSLERPGKERERYTGFVSTDIVNIKSATP